MFVSLSKEPKISGEVEICQVNPARVIIFVSETAFFIDFLGQVFQNEANASSQEIHHEKIGLSMGNFTLYTQLDLPSSLSWK